MFQKGLVRLFVRNELHCPHYKEERVKGKRKEKDRGTANVDMKGNKGSRNITTCSFHVENR